jgi:hypothetical protein
MGSVVVSGSKLSGAQAGSGGWSAGRGSSQTAAQIRAVSGGDHEAAKYAVVLRLASHSEATGVPSDNSWARMGVRASESNVLSVSS